MCANTYVPLLYIRASGLKQSFDNKPELRAGPADLLSASVDCRDQPTCCQLLQTVETSGPAVNSCRLSKPADLLSTPADCQNQRTCCQLLQTVETGGTAVNSCRLSRPADLLSTSVDGTNLVKSL